MVRSKNKTKNTFSLLLLLPSLDFTPNSFRLYFLSEWQGGMGNWGSLKVHRPSSPPLLPPCTFPLLQHEVPLKDIVLHELFQHRSFPWGADFQEQPAPLWFPHAGPARKPAHTWVPLHGR